jgi:uncharacterized membrane protein YqjE
VKTAAYIGKLTTGGVDPKTAQTHGEAIETLLADEYVTKSYLDSKLSELKASIFQAMLLQGIGLLTAAAALIKLLK